MVIIVITRGYHPLSRIIQGRGIVAVLPVLLGGLLYSCPAPAWALIGDSEGLFGLDGSIRTIGALIDNYEFPPLFGEHEYDGYSQTILRLTAGGRPNDELSYAVHLVNSLMYFSGAAAPSIGGLNLSAGITRYRALDATWEWLTEKDILGLMWLDRFNVKAALPFADITVGRQAITFGKTYFWNVLDVYLPFDPTQFDRDYKPGVDALRLDIPLGILSGATLVGVLGREIDAFGEFVDDREAWDVSWFGSSVLARFFTNLEGWDLALQGGKIYGGYQLGGGFVGETLGLQVRGEGSYFWAQGQRPLPAPFSGDLVEDHFSSVMGIGRRFENTLDLQLEYFYNGGGEADNLNAAWLRLRNGAILNLSRHLMGFVASYDILPILVGQVGMIYSLSDSSYVVQPLLTLSLTDNADLLVGANINGGTRPEGDSSDKIELQSEFGTFPDFYFFEIKWYF